MDVQIRWKDCRMGTPVSKTINLKVDLKDTVGKLKKISQQLLGDEVSDIRLSYNGNPLDNNRELVSEICPVHREAIIDARRRWGPVNYLWKDYVAKHYPNHLEQNVPVQSPRLGIHFYCGEFDDHVDTSLIKDFTPHMQDLDNIWCNYFNSSTPVYWTDHTPTQRLMVLKLRHEFTQWASPDPSVMMQKIEEVKYNMNGINKSYYGGDARSWQRYTWDMPLSGKIITTPSSVEFQLEETLRADTWYALVLLHTCHRTPLHVYEDLVIPFKTIGAVTKPLVGDTITHQRNTIQTKQKNELLPGTPLCVICKDEKVSVVITSCGHACLCSGCSESLANQQDNNKRRCPLCQKVFQRDSMIKMYLP